LSTFLVFDKDILGNGAATG